MTTIPVATLLFDLDGTLTDPERGIVASCRAALMAMGRPLPPDERLRELIGPPLRIGLRQFLGEGDDPDVCLAHYRRHYAEHGIFDAYVYPGIVAALGGFSSHRRFVCTVKPTFYAVPVVKHFGLAPYFDGVYGADLDGRNEDKADLIAHMLAVEGFDPARTVMIGDRNNDVRAAARNAIRTIGVTWGHGGREELAAAGAAAICETPAELAGAVEAVLGLR